MSYNNKTWRKAFLGEGDSIWFLQIRNIQFSKEILFGLLINVIRYNRSFALFIDYNFFSGEQCDPRVSWFYVVLLGT